VSWRTVLSPSSGLKCVVNGKWSYVYAVYEKENQENFAGRS
jgi:hypothetical protein